MASYHLSVKTVSRATGRSGPGAAAYRTATRIECERDGTVHDYTRRSGVEGKAFIVAPEGAAWAQDRARLWNAVEAAEKRKDAKVAREYELALPHELDREGRRALAREFAEAVVERFGVAADVAVHMPGREGDQRNWHAHVLTTTRVVGAEGLGAKTRELDVVQTSGPAVEALRELWAIQVNVALERIQAEARVDHRSFARRGVERETEQHLGVAASGMERRAARQQARKAAIAAEVPAPERAGEAQGRPQEAARAVVGPVGVPEPAQGRQGAQTAQDGLERPRKGQARAEAFRSVETTALDQDGPVRPSAGVFGAGAAPVTRIGQRNAETQERNRAAEAARRALEVAQRVLGELERAAREGVRRVLGLARGLGAQVVEARQAREREAERQRQARERVEVERRAEQEREARARLAERERQAAELRRKEAERARPWDAEAYRKGLAEEGSKLREQEKREQAREQQQPKQSRGMGFGR